VGNFSTPSTPPQYRGMPAVPPLPVELRLKTRLGVDGPAHKTYCLDLGHDPYATEAAQAMLATIIDICSVQDTTDRTAVADKTVIRVLDVAPGELVRYQDSSAFQIFLNNHCTNHHLPAQVNSALSDCLHIATGHVLPPAEISNDQQFKLLLLILVCAAVDVACVMLWKRIIRRNHTIMVAQDSDLATRLHEEAQATWNSKAFQGEQ
jgi:hypothetical protein